IRLTSTKTKSWLVARRVLSSFSTGLFGTVTQQIVHSGVGVHFKATSSHGTLKRPSIMLRAYPQRSGRGSEIWPGTSWQSNDIGKAYNPEMNCRFVIFFLVLSLL